VGNLKAQITTFPNCPHRRVFSVSTLFQLGASARFDERTFPIHKLYMRWITRSSAEIVIPFQVESIESVLREGRGADI
jgi:hypothetical protein